MKKLLLLCLVLGITGSLCAQIITIKDKETGQPIELATLKSDNPRAFSTTNVKGRTDISAFKNAEHIEISAMGYKTIIKSYSYIDSLNYEIHLQPAILNMDKIIVSATRWRQMSGKQPSRIISIYPREVGLQNPQTAADLLGISGRIYIQKSQQGGGSPMIRGFATNRLLYTIDGVRMNTAIFRGGNIQNVISLDPFAIENTEVVFGPGSVIYGSDAIGGVMSFQTLTPQLSYNGDPLITGKAEARYASANSENTGHFDINAGWNKWAFLTSISSYKFDDLRMGSRGPDDYLKPYYIQRQDSMDVVITNKYPRVQIPSAYSQMNMMQKIRFKPNEEWDLQYGFHYSETSDYGRYDRHLRMRNGLPRYAEWYYGPQKWMMNDLIITNTENRKIYDEITIRAAWQSFEESRIDRSLNKDIRSIRKEEVEAYSCNVDLVKSLNNRNKLFYGAEYVLNDVTSTGIDENIASGDRTPGPSRYPEATWQSIAGYIHDQHTLSDALIIQGGLRYNRYLLTADFDTTFYPFPFTKADINNGALTGSLGLVYRPSEKSVITANTSTAFRSPNVDDIGKVFDSEPGSVVVPNPDLEAEYAWDADFGIARMFGEIMKIDLSVYYTYLDNALVRRNFTLNGRDSIVYDGVLSQVQAIQNAASAEVYGIQAGLEIKLPAGFGLMSDFNYQKGEEELDNGTTSPSRHAAPWFGITRFIYKNNGINLQLYGAYQGKYDFDDLAKEEQGKTEIYALDKNGNPYAPGWFTLNFKGMVRLTDNLSVSVGLENLTDKRYRPYSSGICAPGRNFIISLRTNF